MYTDEYLLDYLKALQNKYGKIQSQLLDKEPGAPTRKCYVSRFGSFKNACELIGYTDLIPGKLTFEEAQTKLNKYNSHLDLLKFVHSRQKCTVQCRDCGAIFKVYLHNVLTKKSESTFGCTVCNGRAIQQQLVEKLNKNNLTYISADNSNSRITVECNICHTKFEQFRSNLINPKFICPHCSKKIRQKTQLSKCEFYSINTQRYLERSNHIDNLISSDSLLWYYCLGFLFADGHFDVQHNRINLTLHIKDLDSIKTLAQILKIDYKLDEKKNIASIDFCYKNLNELVTKYSISNRKTYEPCNLNYLVDKALIAFLIGFIDGDGSIGYRAEDKTKNKITIKLHKSWAKNLDYLITNTYKYFVDCSNIKIPKVCYSSYNNSTYVSISFGNKQVLSGLKKFIIDNNIPAMKRKWNKII